MSDLPDAGFIPVDKPAGPTSHDAVAAARRALGRRRIGHTGTLDPFASGLLLLAIGKATRLAEFLDGLPKSYSAVMRLGQATDTDDRTGEAIEPSGDWTRLDRPTIENALASMVGTIEQLPPLFSAKKVGGRRMYELAREGREIDRVPVRVTVHSIAATQIEGSDVTFEITCSTGTYIRAIARDAGIQLGVGGHLVELRRTAIGPHGVEDAVPLEGLADREAVRRAWITPARAIAHLQAVEVGEVEVAALSHGRAIPVPAGTEAGVTAALGGGELVAVGEVSAGSLQPRKVFAE